MSKTRIMIFTEDILETAKEHNNAKIPVAYPNGLHAGIAGAFPADKYEITEAGMSNIREVVTSENLAKTDVLLWWGHMHHHEVPDDIAELVVKEVQKGLGFIALHSSHMSKPFTRLVGTSGTLSWCHDDRERVWVTAPYHPIARNVPKYFDLPEEELYAEPFDIPNPEDTVFVGWFASGNVFRSGLTYRRGYGRVFYFQPGHEEYPIYYDDIIRLILRNAVEWATPEIRLEKLECPHVEPTLEAKCCS